MTELSEEQIAIIARNRILALERLAASKRKLQEESILCKSAKIAELESTKSKVVISKRSKIKFQLCSPTSFNIYGGQHLDSLLRKYTGCFYDIKEKTWRLPLSHYREILSQLDEEDRPEEANKIPEETLRVFENPKTAEVNFDLKYLDAPIRNTLYPFQKEGIKMALSKKGRVILADDMGLGKSIQAIAISLYYRLEWPLLVITPASMTATWHEQLKRWLVASIDPQDISVVYDGKGSLDGTVNVISYDLAVKFSDIIKAKKFKVIIADESHAFRNSSTKRAKFIVPVLKKASRVILLSGTPALSRPIELLTQIQAVAPKLFPNLFNYGIR